MDRDRERRVECTNEWSSRTANRRWTGIGNDVWSGRTRAHIDDRRSSSLVT